MNKCILYFISLLWCTPLFSQATFIDSLELLIPNATIEEKSKLKFRTWPYLEQILDTEERLQQAQRFVEVSNTLKDSMLLNYAYRTLSDAYKVNGDTLNSKQALDKGLTVGSQYGYSLGDSWGGAGSMTSAYTFLSIYKDSNGVMNIDSIRKRPNIFEINHDSEHLDFDKAYWCKIKLRGHPEKTDDYLFQVSGDYAGKKSWNHIAAYLIHEDGSVEKQQAGFALQQAEKSIPYPANLFRFNIAQNEKAVLYLRLEGVEEARKPASISMLVVEDGYYLDMEGGYEFKGEFYRNVNSFYSFVSNNIYHHEIVEDTTGTMSIDTVYTNWQFLDRKNWMNVKPAEDKVYWLKAKFIGNPTFNGEQVIHVTNYANNDLQSFDYVDAYIPDGKGGFHHQRTGDRVALSERPYHFWATFLKVEVPLNDTLELMVRLAGADAQYSPNQILLTHIDESSIWPDQINKGLWWGMILGIFGVQALYFLFLFFAEKNWLHLYLASFVLGWFIAFGFKGENYSQFVALPIWKEMLISLNISSLFLVLFGLIKFTEVYFNYPKTSRLAKWIIPLYFFALVIFILFDTIIDLALINHSTSQLLLNILLAIGLIISLTIVFSAKKQVYVSKSFFLLAFLPFLALILCLVITELLPQVLDSQSTLRNYIQLNRSKIFEVFGTGVPLSVVFCLIMLALSTGKRTNALKAEKEKALQKNLEDQKQRLAEQQRVNQAISRFVPNEFLHALGKTDITQITLGDTVEKEVTVFFSDIRDYTTIAEALSPEENFKFVNRYNGRMGPIIQNNQGFVNQYLGDGIMAIFPNTPANALRSAIEMQQVIRRYNQERISEGRRGIKVGMGLHTGSLIMGITGDENRLDATTISDSVNSAARIENLTKYYGTSILLSEVSLKKIKNPNEFHFRYLGEVQVKGKQKPLKIHECFDADLPEVIALKVATLETFNAGIQHYFKQSFSQAILSFEAIVIQNSADKTAQLFLHKARQLEKMGVSENWTGVELMVQK